METVATTKEGGFEVNKTVVKQLDKVENEDGTLTYTITLNDGLLFSDGTPVTAKNYLYYTMVFSTLVASEAEGKDRQAGLTIVGFEEFNAYDGTNEGDGVSKTFTGLRLLADNLARDPRAKITLGCLPSLGLSLVPELVTDFYQQNSNLVMTLTTEHTETLVKKLDLREIDLALTLQPVQQGEILTTLIAEVPLVYIDRHYRQGAVEIDQIDQQRWISPGPHSLSAAIATRRDFSTTRLNVQTYYMATEFVKRGMGCSITDIFSAQHNLAPEMIHPITPPMAINLCLLRRADVSLSPMAQKFVDFLCQRLRQQLKEINLRLYPDHKKSIAPLG